MVELHRRDLFPTPIWHFQLERAESINQKLLPLIQKLHQTDSGLKVSNRLGWHSQDNLHQLKPFREFLAEINSQVREIADTINWDVAKAIPMVNNCWANINGKYGYNKVHNHPNSILSGIYYVSVPGQCGDVFFYDPRLNSNMLMPPVSKSTPWTAGKASYKPQSGMMIIFPSWLWHGVEPNLNDELRISISFNIGMTASKFSQSRALSKTQI